MDSQEGREQTSVAVTGSSLTTPTAHSAIQADRPRIALVQLSDARSIRTWSGTVLFMKEALERHVGEVTDLSPYPGSMIPWKILGNVIGRISNRRWSSPHDPLLARRAGAYFSRLLKSGSFDVVFAPASSSIIAFLETDVPVVYYSDATWDLVAGYLECYTNLAPRYSQSAELAERQGLSRSALAFFSSEWGAASATDHYGIPRERVRVLPLGANLPTPPNRSDVLPPSLDSTVKLLFCGVSYQNKGGPIARHALVELLSMGIDAELTILGCVPPESERHPNMTVIPFLDKSIPTQREEFERVWRRANIFILPTRFEAAGLVFAEASAHAIPSFAPNTGGIAAMVRDGINGYLLPYDAGGREYARAIATLIGDRDAYFEMCEASRNEFDTRLNWDVWGRTMASEIDQLLGRSQPL